MKTVKYIVSKNEDIGNISYGAIITNARLIYSENNEGLIYLPRKLKLLTKDKINDNYICGSLNFAQKVNNDMWKRNERDFLNITIKKYEK